VRTFLRYRLQTSVAVRQHYSRNFYLKTKGKKRGYVEKQELDLGNNFPNNITVEFVSPDGTVRKMLDKTA
jgi:cell wall assembly regulator SMI1